MDRPTLFYGAIDILHVLTIGSTTDRSICTVISLQRERLNTTCALDPVILISTGIPFNLLPLTSEDTYLYLEVFCMFSCYEILS